MPYEKLDDDERATLRAWLVGKNIELNGMREMPLGHFAASFRGSSWTASKRCVGVDCAIGESQTPDAYEWATRVVGNKMAIFSRKKYHEDLAGTLACFWGRQDGVVV